MSKSYNLGIITILVISLLATAESIDCQAAQFVFDNAGTEECVADCTGTTAPFHFKEDTNQTCFTADICNTNQAYSFTDDSSKQWCLPSCSDDLSYKVSVVEEAGLKCLKDQTDACKNYNAEYYSYTDDDGNKYCNENCKSDDSFSVNHIQKDTGERTCTADSDACTQYTFTDSNGQQYCVDPCNVGTFTFKKVIGQTKTCEEACEAPLYYYKRDDGQMYCYDDCDAQSLLKYNQECVATCPTGTFASVDAKECFDACNDDTNKYVNSDNNACVSDCDGILIDVAESACVTACGSEQVKSSDQSQCLLVCPDAQYLSVDKTACLTACPSDKFIDLDGFSCIDSCGSASSGQQCTSDCVDPQYDADSVCVDECPDGQFKFTGDSGNVCVDECPPPTAQGIFDNKMCISDCTAENGLTSADTKRCVTECSSGQVLNSAETACLLACPAGKFASDGFCVDSCNPGFYAKDGEKPACTVCAQTNCIACMNGDQCSVCDDGFIVADDGNCIVEPTCSVENCDLCVDGDATVCQTCGQGYTYNAGDKTCDMQACPDGQEFSGAGCICSEAAKYLDNTGSCVACPDKCLECDGSECFACQDGFYVDGNACTACLSDCEICQKGDTCEQCAAGKTFIGDGCKQSQVQAKAGQSLASLTDASGAEVIFTCPSGCSKCSSPEVCTTAQKGFVVKIGTATKCGKNCATCQASNVDVCNSCLDGFFYNEVKKNCAGCADALCTGCAANPNFCTKCVSGYGSKVGKCEACGQNCKRCTFDDQGVESCSSCSKGYYPVQDQSGNSYCDNCLVGCADCDQQKPTNCNQCASGFYANTGDTKLYVPCLQCKTGCLTCTSESDCSAVLDGFRLVNGDVAPPCPEGCTECSDDASTCTGCFGGYEIVDGLCKAGTSCNAQANCVVCPEGFALQSKKCNQCQISGIANCVTCRSTDITACKKCANGFYLSDGACTACKQQCTSCSDESLCSACADGYVLDGDSCIKCDKNCAKCENSKSLCTECPGNRELQGTTCLPKKYVKTQFVVDGTLQNAAAFFLSFKKGLAIKILKDVKKMFLIFTQAILTGSTKIEARIEPDDTVDSSAIQNSVGSLVSGEPIGDVNIVSASGASVDDTTTTTTTEGSTSNPNLAIILSVVLTALLLIVLAVILSKVVNKNNDQSLPAESDDKNPGMEVI